MSFIPCVTLANSTTPVTSIGGGGGSNTPYDPNPAFSTITLKPAGLSGKAVSMFYNEAVGSCDTKWYRPSVSPGAVAKMGIQRNREASGIETYIAGKDSGQQSDGTLKIINFDSVNVVMSEYSTTSTATLKFDAPLSIPGSSNISYISVEPSIAVPGKFDTNITNSSGYGSGYLTFPGFSHVQLPVGSDLYATTINGQSYPIPVPPGCVSGTIVMQPNNGAFQNFSVGKAAPAGSRWILTFSPTSIPFAQGGTLISYLQINTTTQGSDEVVLSVYPPLNAATTYNFTGIAY
jgi:hypothetical protein